MLRIIFLFRPCNCVYLCKITVENMHLKFRAQNGVFHMLLYAYMDFIYHMMCNVFLVLARDFFYLLFIFISSVLRRVLTGPKYLLFRLLQFIVPSSLHVIYFTLLVYGIHTRTCLGTTHRNG